MKKLKQIFTFEKNPQNSYLFILMKKIKFLLILFIIAFSSLSCEVLQEAAKQLETSTGSTLTTQEVGAGLKQALEKGASFAGANASRTDGFFKNNAIKLLFPPEAKKVENTLRNIGAGKLVDDFILSLNRSAEDACKQAAPIFISAIRQMSIQDAWGILRGGQSAATDYLKRTTSTKLKTKFKPVITNSLKKPLIKGTNLSAYKSWNDVTSRYNKVPLVKPVQTNLADYATQKAIDGLFYFVAQEEAKIRRDPVARTTELLRKVFARQNG